MAFDYILKPFSINESQETIVKAKFRLKIWNILHQIEDEKENILESNGKLILKLDKGTKVISVNEIVYVEPDNSYCKIHFINGEVEY